MRKDKCPNHTSGDHFIVEGTDKCICGYSIPKTKPSIGDVKEAIECWGNGSEKYDSEKCLGVLLDLASAYVSGTIGEMASEEEIEDAIRRTR